MKKAKLLTKYFNIYGYGNFDLTLEEISELLTLTEKEDSEGLSNLYERLYKIRMGENTP